MRRGYATIFTCQLMTRPLLLAIATLALHLHQLLARRLQGAIVLMAGGHAFVRASYTQLAARLLAYLARRLTYALVAHLDALVLATA